MIEMFVEIIGALCSQNHRIQRPVLSVSKRGGVFQSSETMSLERDHTFAPGMHKSSRLVLLHPDSSLAESKREESTSFDRRPIFS